MTAANKFWDKIAEKYAASPISDQATYEKKLAETQQYFKPEMQILEFGCGTGGTAIAHAKHVSHVDAIDISGNMLDIARAKSAAAGTSNITFTQGTLIEFNAAPNQYDVILALNVLHLLPDRQATMAEVARILKPGGIFISDTACLGNSRLRFLSWIAPIAKWLGLLPDVFVFKDDELVAELTANGFTVENQWRNKKGIGVFIVASKR